MGPGGLPDGQREPVPGLDRQEAGGRGPGQGAGRNPYRRLRHFRDGGYTPCVYANRWQGYYDYDLSQLADADLWISAPGTWDDFYYAHTIWQYSYEGHVEGISAAVDRNLRFLPITE